MTLEKLLIFGVGLAVVIAITGAASTMTANNEPRNTTYETNVIDLIELSK